MLRYFIMIVQNQTYKEIILIGFKIGNQFDCNLQHPKPLISERIVNELIKKVISITAQELI